MLRYRWTVPTVTGALAYVRQSNFGSWPGQSALGDPQSLTQTLTLPLNVLAGSALVLFATDSNGGNPGPSISLSDTLSNSYSQKQKIDDTLSSGWQSTYAYVVQNTSAGALTLTATYGNVEWQGLMLLEIANVPASCYLGVNGNLQTGYTATTTDGITSNTIAGGGVRAILLGFGMALGDQGVPNGGSGLGRPNAGTGFSTVSEIWNWHGEENTSNAPAAIVTYKNYSSMGTVAATFTGTGGTDDYSSIAIALQSN